MLVCGFVLISSLFFSAPTVTNAGKLCHTYPCLIFEDNFDELNFHNWYHEVRCDGCGNGEFQCYWNNRENSYVKDGVLHLKPIVMEQPPYVYSARVNSNLSFAYRYGRLEIRAKMPLGDWIWPALWLLPRHNRYGDWPASGEIDLVESRGNRKLFCGTDNIGVNQMGSTLHYGPFWPHNPFMKNHNVYNGEAGNFLSDEWHRYRLDWDKSGMKFFVDDMQILEIGTGHGYWVNGQFGNKLLPSSNPWKNGDIDAPFDQDFFIVMNVAVGGSNGYFPDDCTNRPYPKPWKNSQWAIKGKNPFMEKKHLWYPTWPQGDERAMRVDYVRVWKMSEDQDK